MAIDEKKLLLRLEADNAKLLKKLDQSTKQIKKFKDRARVDLKKVERTFNTLGNAFAFVGVTLAFRKIINATKEQEAASAQLKQTLVSTGNTVGRSYEELIKQAQEFQRVSTFGDEEIIRAQSQLATFTKITGNEFQRTTELALDLSIKMGQDLRSSVLQLGKALNDPIANLGALGRAGIQFDKSQQNIIKTLFKSGQTSKAQGLILEELQKQFGGSARAARETFGGALEALGNAAGDLLESDSLGGVTKSLNELIEVLEDPETKKAAQNFSSFIVDSIGVAAMAFVGWDKLLSSIKDSYKDATNVIDATSIEDQKKLLDELLASRNQLLRQARDAGEGSPLFKRWNEAADELLPRIQSVNKRLITLVQLKNEASGGEFLNPTGEKPDLGEESLINDDEIFDADKALKDLQKTLDNTKPPLVEYNEKVADANQLLMTGKITQQEYNSAIRAYAEEVNKANGATEEYQDRLKLAAKVTEEAKSPLLSMLETVSELQKLAEDGLISDDVLKRTIAALNASVKKVDELDEAVSEFAKEAERNLQNGLVDVLVSGFDDGLSSMADSFVDFLKRAAAELLASELLQLIKSLGFFGGDKTASSVDTAFAAIGSFIGGKAGGGSIGSGQFALVGEQGPEFVSGPAMVYSNKDTAGMMGGDVIVNIDARNADPLAAEQFVAMGNALEQKILNTVSDRRARGRL